MSKDWKVYHRYIPISTGYTATTTENTGSRDLSSTSLPVDIIYQMQEKSPDEVEAVFKEKYPLQYQYLKSKFQKKLRKILKANEEAIP